MNRQQKLYKEIIDLTTEIETNYPELYKFLGEDPITILPNVDLNEKTFRDYLESLKQLVRHHLETHHIPNISN